jgi:hypothetical protein
LIGVTIGVGEYYLGLARVAAACLKKHTGLDSVILSDRHFMESHLHHPAALKFRIFDLANVSNILYYDADWFCVRQWSPQSLANHSRLVACHDFVLASDWPSLAFDFEAETALCRAKGSAFVDEPCGLLRHDYISDVEGLDGVGLPPRRWVNTGMFIANRQYHSDWLKCGESLYIRPGGHHERYFEQPALLRSLAQLRLGVDYLPRTHNILVTRMSTWGDSAVALHLKMSKRQEFSDLIHALHEGRLTPEVIEDLFLAGRARSHEGDSGS